jgi:hypothetical protein
MIPLFTAENARVNSKNDLIIFDEIVYISRVIINESLDGTYQATIAGDTTMTTTELYYQSWIGTSPDRQIYEQMVSVIQHFEKLGYTITRKTNAMTGNNISWFVQW